MLVTGALKMFTEPYRTAFEYVILIFLNLFGIRFMVQPCRCNQWHDIPIFTGIGELVGHQPCIDFTDFLELNPLAHQDMDDCAARRM